MPRYTITVEFNTDRVLNQDELDLITGACVFQVEEPTDFEGNDLDVTVTDVAVNNMVNA